MARLKVTVTDFVCGNPKPPRCGTREERREMNEKFTRFRSLTLRTRGSHEHRDDSSESVYIRFSSRSLAKSVRLKNNPKAHISCGTSLIAVKLSECNDVTGSDHFK